MPEKQLGQDGNEGPMQREWASPADKLRSIPLFSKLCDDDLAWLASTLIERRYAKGTVILEEGLPGKFMYIVREGRVKVSMASGDGRERITGLLEVGEFFGELALIDGRPRSATVTALAPTRVSALSRNDFLDLLSRSPDLSMELIRVLVDRLRESDHQAAAMSFLGVRERTKRALLHLASTDPQSSPGPTAFGPPVTHQQIADLVGSSRETVTRAIQQLKRAGEVEQKGKRYRLRPAVDEFSP